MSDHKRIEFSMSPLYVTDLMAGLEVACETDPTVRGAITRLKVAIRASGYTEESLEKAAAEELEERLGKGFTIIDDE